MILALLTITMCDGWIWGFRERKSRSYLLFDFHKADYPAIVRLAPEPSLNVFTGVNACVRKVKKIRNLIEKNQHSFATLADEYNVETICNIAKELLDADWFESLQRRERSHDSSFLRARRKLLSHDNTVLLGLKLNRLWPLYIRNDWFPLTTY